MSRTFGTNGEQYDAVFQSAGVVSQQSQALTVSHFSNVSLVQTSFQQVSIIDASCQRFIDLNDQRINEQTIYKQRRFEQKLNERRFLNVDFRIFQ